MNNYGEQVTNAVRASTINSSTSYSWFGKFSVPYPQRQVRVFTSGTARTLLLFDLQNQLYSNFYCCGGARPAGDDDIAIPEVATEDFVADLARANRGKGFCEDPGWTVRQMLKDQVLVRRGPLEAWVRSKDCLSVRATLAPGMPVSLRVSREARRISPGFYFVLGKTLWPYTTRAIVRFYWNLTAEGALRFLRTATTLLDRAAVPFRLKVLNHPDRFNRCDAGLLYLRQQDCDAASKHLVKIFAEIRPFLQQGTPALTHTLAPGLGWAEDPGGSEATIYRNSFGTHRCYLLADGMIRAYEQRKISLEERLQVVERRFREEGVNLEEPFRDFRRRRYSLDHLAAQLDLCRSDRTVSPRQPENSLLGSAQEIGHRIAREAIWDGNRCNWLGAALPSTGLDLTQEDLGHTPLGVDLYSGTAGVALFLAELCAEGGKDLRHSAVGAIRHSLSGAETVAAGDRLALYTGWTGMALAAARVGVITGDSEWLEQSDKLVKRMSCEEKELNGFDLLSGKAGAIVGLLSLRRVFKYLQLSEMAHRLGEKLLREANWDHGACSWKSERVKSLQNLTGLAQGAAGAAYALLELFQETGDAKFRKAAEGAFEYERRKFDREACNWPDFRSQANQPRSLARRGALSFANSWSHGAPGITLSRLHAVEILKNGIYKLEVMSAAKTIRQSLDDWRKLHSGNWSLAEGLAGNCEVLLCASDMMAPELGAERSFVSEIVQEACGNYAQPGHHWPCATKAGKTPSLMLGLAGVGYLCLRLLKPQISPVLAFRPEAHAGSRDVSAAPAATGSEPLGQRGARTNRLGRPPP